MSSLEKLTKQDKELINALDEQVALQQQTITALKSVSSIDDKVLASYQTSLDEAKIQIERWKAKASFWRKLAGFGLPAALIVGAAIGWAAKN